MSVHTDFLIEYKKLCDENNNLKQQIKEIRKGYKIEIDEVENLLAETKVDLEKSRNENKKLVDENKELKLHSFANGEFKKYKFMNEIIKFNEFKKYPEFKEFKEDFIKDAVIYITYDLTNKRVQGYDGDSKRQWIQEQFSCFRNKHKLIIEKYEILDKPLEILWWSHNPYVGNKISEYCPWSRNILDYLFEIDIRN